MIKGKTSVNILVSNYTNVHVTFNKGEYIGHLKLTLMDDATIHQSEVHTSNSVTLQKMMAEQVKPDTFDPPHHALKTDIQNLIHFSGNMKHSLQKMRHPSGQPP